MHKDSLIIALYDLIDKFKKMNDSEIENLLNSGYTTMKFNKDRYLKIVIKEKTIENFANG